jgi:xanthine/uracil permease
MHDVVATAREARFGEDAPVTGEAHAEHDAAPVFEIGVNARMPLKDSILMGFQNVFVMTGIFVFPGIMGRSFGLPPETVAYLYGATFIGCGLTTLLIAGLFGRMPLVAGPYAGIFTALITFGHLPGSDLGAGFGSLCVASLAWCALSIPIKGKSAVSLLAGVVRNPAIAGVIVMLVMMQIADLSFPHWLGKPDEATFPGINFAAGLATAVVLMVLTVSRVRAVRRLSLLIALAVGAAVFEAFHPIDFAQVAHSPWFVMPRLFPFGLSFNPEYCLVFFIVLVAINIQTLTLMGVVGEWAGEEMTPARLSLGVFAMMLGSALASCIGSFSNLPYPANVAMLRSTRVASRSVTIATGAILVLMGFCTKIDYIFVLLPVPVLSAAATVLFGIVFVHGVELLAKVDWTERRLTIAGFSLMIGFGSLFIEPKTLEKMPLVIGLLLRQPIIVGVTSLLLLTAFLPGRAPGARPKPKTAPLPVPVSPVTSHQTRGS